MFELKNKKMKKLNKQLLYLLFVSFFLIICCQKKTRLDNYNKIEKGRELTEIIEVAFNICEESKKKYFFENEDSKINIIIGKKNDPFTRSIKIFNHTTTINHSQLKESGIWVIIWTYQFNENFDEFYMLYKIKSSETFVEVNMKKINNKWHASKCKITSETPHAGASF